MQAGKHSIFIRLCLVQQPRLSSNKRLTILLVEEIFVEILVINDVYFA